MPDKADIFGVDKILPVSKVKLSPIVIVFELFDVIVLPDTFIEPRVASPLVIIEALMFITPPDTSSIVFVFTAAEPVVEIFPDELIPVEPLLLMNLKWLRLTVNL